MVTCFEEYLWAVRKFPVYFASRIKLGIKENILGWGSVKWLVSMSALNECKHIWLIIYISCLTTL